MYLVELQSVSLSFFELYHVKGWSNLKNLIHACFKSLDKKKLLMDPSMKCKLIIFNKAYLSGNIKVPLSPGF